MKGILNKIPKFKFTKKNLVVATVVLLMTVGSIMSYIAEKKEKNRIYVPPENIVTERDETGTDSDLPVDITPEGDYYISRDYQNFLEEYPWYIYIPIDKPDYSISYNFEKQQFKIRLKINRGSSQQTVDRLTQQAIKDINMIGASTERYGYYILFQDD